MRRGDNLARYHDIALEPIMLNYDHFLVLRVGQSCNTVSETLSKQILTLAGPSKHWSLTSFIATKDPPPETRI